MSVIEEIAHHQRRRDEIPNQELAAKLAQSEDRAGIEEIASYLEDKNAFISSDCIKVLYTIGYTRPDLIQPYAGEFIKLLSSKQTGMVWGGMIALSTLAPLTPHELWQHIDKIEAITQEGAVITEVSGIKTLVSIAAASEEYRARINPLLLHLLETSRPNDFVTRVSVLLPVMVSEADRERFLQIIEQRRSDLKSGPATMLERILKTYLAEEI